MLDVEASGEIEEVTDATIVQSNAIVEAIDTAIEEAAIEQVIEETVVESNAIVGAMEEAIEEAAIEEVIEEEAFFFADTWF